MLWQGKALHACSNECTVDEDDPVHGRDVTQPLADALSLVSLGSHSSGQGLWWCPRHTRVHACDAECKNADETNLGFRQCALSSRTVGSSLKIAYGDGTYVVSSETSHQRSVDAAAARDERNVKAGNDLSRSVTTVSRTGYKRKGSALDKIIARRAAVGYGGGGGAGEDAEDDSYIDLDEPSDDLFAEGEHENTFGDNLATTLLQVYSQAYATVHHIIFSEARARIEAETEAAFERDVSQRLHQYVNDQKKRKDVVFLDVCKQLQHAAEAKHKRVFKKVLVPKNAIPRMKAYYSAVCMEFYMQLKFLVTSLLQDAQTLSSAAAYRLKPKAKAAFERFQGQNIADVAPNIFDIMHEGLKVQQHDIVKREVLFQHVFPESLTLQKLGISQKLCTDTKKLIKQCARLVITSHKPIEKLQVTQMDLNAVMRGNEPVISMFLQCRRERLGL